VIEATLAAYSGTMTVSLEAIEEADRWARAHARELMRRTPRH